jgi:CRISPR-associated protein Cas6
LLKASGRLWSRTVIIKVAESPKVAEPSSFLRAIDRQLSDMGVSAKVELELAATDSHSDEFARRILKVKDTVITGYGVTLDSLNEIDSLKVQELGLGGRRRMGCGLFVPVSPRDKAKTQEREQAVSRNSV